MLDTTTTNEQGKGQGLVVMMHIGIWLLVFIAPLSLMGNQEELLFNKRLLMRYVPFLFFPVAFYVNYYLLVPQLLFKKKTGYYILSAILLIIVLMVLQHLLTRYVLFHEGPPHMGRRNLSAYLSKRFWRVESISRAMISLATMIGLSTAIRVSYRWLRDAHKGEQLKKEKAMAELSLLKHQVNPHFFFNTLNNIYALIELRPQDAQQAVHRLSQMMRYVLYESEERLVPLNKELHFLEQYIELMKMRVSKGVEIEAEWPDKVEDRVKVPPLLLVTFVENAFKHGVSYQHPSWIRIKCTLVGKKLFFEIRNSNVKASNQPKVHEGIGLKNIKKRLDLLYEATYELEMKQNEHEFQVKLILDAYES
ncbi:sensor histidine kinase [Algivirga pacifica]|uniref:Histidine kinase n=1 Tax=Algivirga pacifica TaxID=1162670 RepID=A0ABP9D484_9BACT